MDVGLCETIKNEKLDLKYILSPNSSNLINPQDNIRLKVHSLIPREKEEGRNLVTKLFRKNYRKKEFFNSPKNLFDPFFSKYEFDSLYGNIENFKNDLKRDSSSFLEEHKFKKFYNPRKIGFWENMGVLKIINGMLIGMSAYVSAKTPEVIGTLSIVNGAALGFLEVTRTLSIIQDKNFHKNFQKKYLKETIKDLNHYENFENNLQKAEIEIINPPKAASIYEDLINTRKMGNYIPLNIDKANKEIMKSYKKGE